MDISTEKERKQLRRLWVAPLVKKYLKALEDILPTPEGQRVVHAEAQHAHKDAKEWPEVGGQLQVERRSTHNTHGESAACRRTGGTNKRMQSRHT